MRRSLSRTRAALLSLGFAANGLACGDRARPSAAVPGVTDARGQSGDANAGPSGGDGGVEPPDEACVRWLEDRGVPFRRTAPAGLMRTPIDIRGAIGPVALKPRGQRPAQMDCTLARALARAGPIFEELGVRELSYSAAYDYRTRRDTAELSGHAYGLAIDVHAVSGAFGTYDVRQHFEAGVGAWRTGATAPPLTLATCIGEPRTDAGRTLRALACRLKLHEAFRVIVTPDDNADHAGHLHIEARSDFMPASSAAPARPAPPDAAPNAPSESSVSRAQNAKSATKKKGTSKTARAKAAKAKAAKAKAAKAKAAKAKAVKTRTTRATPAAKRKTPTRKPSTRPTSPAR